MVSINDVDKTAVIDGLTFEQYCNDPDLVRREAEAAGVRGEEYWHHFQSKGRFTGKKVLRYKPLNNMHLYEFAKKKYQRQSA